MRSRASSISAMSISKAATPNSYVPSEVEIKTMEAFRDMSFANKDSFNTGNIVINKRDGEVGYIVGSHVTKRDTYILVVKRSDNGEYGVRYVHENSLAHVNPSQKTLSTNPTSIVGKVNKFCESMCIFDKDACKVCPLGGCKK